MKTKLLIIGLLTALTVNANVTLPAIVGNNMVLQRETTVNVWGWAEPGEKVTVTFLKKRHTCITGADGKWLVKLPPMKAGGPHTMEVKGQNTIVLNNILIGDVWVCSGQSNMTHYLGRHAERYAQEIAEANLPEIRQFYVPEKATVAGPLADNPGLKWVAATPTTVLDFTVIGYFFAKKLYDAYHVPMGIINTCVGGTPIEAWMSEAGFRDFPDITERIKQNQEAVKAISAQPRNRPSGNPGMNPQEPRQVTDKGMAGPLMWYDPAYQPLNWKPINVPGYWEDQGIRNLDGVVWYRRVINVPASMTGVEATVKLGRIVNADACYINGQQIGNTTYEYPQRVYTVKPNVLKPGSNLIVVRVTNNGGKGGFVPDKPYFLLAAGDTIDLKGEWAYKVGEVAQRFQPMGNAARGARQAGKSTATPRPEAAPAPRPVNAQQSPTGLYNGMIAPYTPYAVRGCLWYQGESNAGNPKAYAKLLPALIEDWRQQWGQDDLTFLIAQLPNYMDVNYSPEESNWAQMRDVQLKTAETVPHTGLGVNIDLGEWNDIHPGNKKPVGERLALQAMRITYGDKQVLSTGPIRRTIRQEGNKLIVSFDNVGSGLVSGNGEPLAHFALAGEDGRYQWAQAEIVGNEVAVWNDNLDNPVSVKYAWADNPDFANLYNKEGLPASPFELSLAPSKEESKDAGQKATRDERANQRPTAGQQPAAVDPANDPFKDFKTELMWEAKVKIGQMKVVGESKRGVRRVIPITGGSFSGPTMKGEVLPGGEDWQLVRPDGDTELYARYLLRTHDGHTLQVVNQALMHTDPQSKAFYCKSVLDIEAPENSPYDALNHAIFLGTLTMPQLTAGEEPYVIIGVYKVL